MVSAELYKAATEKARAGHGPAGGQPGTPARSAGAPEGSKKEEGPIIDAEVVDEKESGVAGSVAPSNKSNEKHDNERTEMISMVVGGLSAIGAGLCSLGIPKNSILQYETALETGKFVLIAHGTAAEVAGVRQVLNPTQPEKLEEHQLCSPTPKTAW